MITLPGHRIGILILGVIPLIYVAGTGSLGQGQQQNEVQIKLSWEYTGLSPGMRVYEPREGPILTVWETGSVKQAKDLPVSREVANSTVTVSRGSHKILVLVYENKTAQPVYFFAAPHNVAPPESSLGLKLKCLCINQAFEVGPGESWYRIIEVQASKNFLGEGFEIKHTIVAIDKERKRKFERPMGFAASDLG
jgi:hypothetical protein